MGEMSDNDNTSTEEKGESQRDVQIASLDRDFTSYTHDGNFSVFFKLIRDRKEAEEDIREGTFYPDFVHQFFGEKERIFGYKRPVIRLFYTASRLKRYVKFDYQDSLSPERDNIAPDDVMKDLSVILEDLEYSQDLNQFINEVESKEEKEFRPPGDLLHEFVSPYKKPPMLSRAQLEQLELARETTLTNGAESKMNGSSTSSTNGATNGDATVQESSRFDAVDTDSSSMAKKKYQIFHANAQTKGFSQFQARMQTLIMWFIESANMVDHEDPRWDFFMIFEKYNPSTSEDPEAIGLSTEDRFYFAGYATVYRYYAYPDRTRPRVSQMLLLPPYRRNGLGTTMLQSIYDYYKKQPATLDITAEDPDEGFIAMRDFLDCRNCLQLPMFQPERLKKGWADDIAKEAQEKLKLCFRQSRKVYEILRLKSIDTEDLEEFRNYRLEVKNRLNVPNQRLKLDCDKVEKRGYELPEELRAQRENFRLAEARLEENYQELMKQYQHTINKLNKAHS